MLKRIFDFCVALIILIVTSPILIVVSALVFIFLGRPVLFPQVRPGLHGGTFTLYKFRTMVNATAGWEHSLCDEERLTKFGLFLRRASLDELPQLFNVLRGDLSLVGPRPLLVEYLPLYSDEQARRHDVRPGITGWAQINGRNTISWEEKFKLDVWYVDNQCLALDLKIIMSTFRPVITSDGVSHVGEATMSKFLGNNCAAKK